MEASVAARDDDPRGDAGALFAAENSSQALRNLYRLRKAANAKHSLAFFCREAGIPSTGYLSDVLSGKRTLATKYKRPIIAAFGLKAERARFLRLLIDRDNEAQGKRRRQLEQKVALARKALKITFRRIPGELQGLFTALEVFCAFSLFRNRPTLTDLTGYFGDGRRGEVEAALATLTGLKLIAVDEEDPTRHRLLTDHIVFSEGTEGFSHVEFLKLALANAVDEIGYWFPKKDESYFSSVTMSVNRQQFRKVLGELKQKMLLTQAELESPEADSLVRFNVQIYPLDRKPK